MITWSTIIFGVVCLLLLGVAAYGAFHSNPNDSPDP